MRLFLISGIILVAGAASIKDASGQASARYNVVRSTVAAGGVTFCHSPRFQLGSTLGQPLIAGANSVRFVINGGFWNVPPSWWSVTKAATGSDLTLGSSWTGGTVPGTGAIATWSVNSLVTALTLNNPESWAGIRLLGGASDVSINGSGPLTFGQAGIDLSASPLNLSLNIPVVLGANQIWNVAAYRSLIAPIVISGGGDRSLCTGARNSQRYRSTGTFLQILGIDGGD